MHRARWFSAVLTRRTAPWAWSRGEPFRTISALELFASLLCTVVFDGAWTPGRKTSIRITGYTDNRGTAFALSKLMTSKFPLLLILVELGAQLEKELDLGLEWIPRDQSEEADALTNGRFDDFDPVRRIDVDLSNIKWLLLPQMAAASEDIHKKFMEKARAATDREGQGAAAREGQGAEGADAEAGGGACGSATLGE